jgi:hypothetical protein
MKLIEVTKAFPSDEQYAEPAVTKDQKEAGSVSGSEALE